MNQLNVLSNNLGDDSCCHLGGAVIMKNNSQRSTINLPIIIDVQLSYRHKNTNGVLDSIYEDVKVPRSWAEGP